MRLICPNCGAQYEVADDVIPASGRDVQCSNCNHTWFERPGASVAEEEADWTDPVAPQTAAPNPVATPTGAVASEPHTEVANSVEPSLSTPEDDAPVVAAELEPYEDEDADDPVPPPVPPTRAAMRTVSPEIAEILRQEAAREEAARRAEAVTGIETQPDLGLDTLMEDEVRRADEARRRLARMRGEAEVAEEPAPVTTGAAPIQDTTANVAAAIAAATRREMLPDIEEINSTLRSANERGAVAVQENVRADESQRRGFRLGYGSILLIAAVLGLIYAFAPRIAAVLPQSESFLVPYVAAIDDGRLWLDLKVQDILTMLEGNDPPQDG